METPGGDADLESPREPGEAWEAGLLKESGEDQGADQVSSRLSSV